MKLVTLDFETYFDQEYTLKKMTTEEYIRDPRFHAYLVGLKYDDRHAVDYVGDQLARNLPADGAVLCHHAQFDGFILSHHYNYRPKFWFDTMAMARLLFPHDKSHSLESLARKFKLGSKTVPYDQIKGMRTLSPDVYSALANGCIQDVELTHALFKKMLPYVPREELKVIDLTIRMFTEPMLRLDRPRLQAYLDKQISIADNTLAQLGVTKEDLHSAEKFAELLRSVGCEPPMKSSPSSPDRQIYALAKTDFGMKELLEHEDARVSALAAARLGMKSTIGTTRPRRMLDMDARGAMPIYLNYCGAHTTRWSGGDKMNWQNLTRGSEMRLSIMAPKGYVIVVGDLAQIECRILNYIADQRDVLDAFARGRDLYSEGASRFYGRPITKADKVERHLGKTLELGCGYGMGWAKFKDTCAKGALGGPSIILDDYEARAAVDSYRTSHVQVVTLWKKLDRALRCMLEGNYDPIDFGAFRIYGKRVKLPNDATLDYTTLGMDRGTSDITLATKKGVVKMYGGKLTENIVQALARVVLSQAMIKIAKRYKIVLNTHDELAWLAPAHEADQALEFGLGVLKETPIWMPGIPLDAEGGYDVRYSK
jgi:hypothetical protein